MKNITFSIGSCLVLGMISPKEFDGKRIKFKNHDVKFLTWVDVLQEPASVFFYARLINKL